MNWTLPLIVALYLHCCVFVRLVSEELFISSAMLLLGGLALTILLFYAGKDLSEEKLGDVVFITFARMSPVILTSLLVITDARLT